MSRTYRKDFEHTKIIACEKCNTKNYVSNLRSITCPNCGNDEYKSLLISYPHNIKSVTVSEKYKFGTGKAKSCMKRESERRRRTENKRQISRIMYGVDEEYFDEILKQKFFYWIYF